MAEDDAAAGSAVGSSASSSAAVAGPPAAADGGYLTRLSEVPGLAEAGWGSIAGVLEMQKDRAALAVRLKELTARLAAHDDAWPFREPVDLSLVPEYAAVVKEPMGACVLRDSVRCMPMPCQDCWNGATRLIAAAAQILICCASLRSPALLLLPPHTALPRADLSLIARRAAGGGYTSLEHYLADVHLMLRNCRAFNRPDTEYVACANKLEAFLRARVSQGIFTLPAAATGAGAGAGSGAGSR